MNQNICNICGANYEYRNGRWICPACGAYKPEELSNEEATLLYNAEQKLRLNAFDDAEELYRDIIRKYPENSRGFWGLVRAQYGIKYEQDYDGKMIPTCYAASYDSILLDKNYLRALELADKMDKVYYAEQAEKIEKIRIEWVEKAQKEAPVDVFISYKDTELENGVERTDDSHEAFELYTHLRDQGYTVFYSRESLKDKTGEKYEPYIFNALNTAKVMIVFGSKPEYIESTWVKNEWSRFYKRIKSGKKQKNALVLVYKGFNPARLSRPLSAVQSINRDSLTFAHDLDSYVRRVVRASTALPHIERAEIKSQKKDQRTAATLETIDISEIVSVNTTLAVRETVEKRALGTVTVPQLTASAGNLLTVAYAYLSNGQFGEAERAFDSFLINNKENGEALIGKLLASTRSKSFKEFGEACVRGFDNYTIISEICTYAAKDKATKLLSVLCSVIINLVNNTRYSQAKEVYEQICSYESSDIAAIRAVLFEKALGFITSEKETAFYFIDTYLLYEQDNRKYIESLHQTVEKTISVGAYDIAEKYAEKLVEFDGADFETQIELLRIKYRSSNIPPLDIIEQKKDYEILKGVISVLDNDSVTKWLKLIADQCCALVEKCNYASALIWLESFAKFKFDERELYLKKIIWSCRKTITEETCDFFDKVIQYYALGDVEITAREYYCFANDAQKMHLFSLAVAYYDKCISLNPHNKDALLYKLYSEMSTSSNVVGLESIINLENFNTFEEILSLCESHDETIKIIDDFLTICNKYVNRHKNASDKKIFEIFEKLVSYIPVGYDDVLITKLAGFASICLSVELYDMAERYYAMIIDVDAENYEAYWGILKAKLHCKTDNELIRQDTPLAELQEFNNALISAAKNAEVMNYYIEIQAKQKEWLKRHNAIIARNRKIKKVSLIALPSLAFVLVVVFLTVNFFIPNIRLNQASELFAKGEYVEAGKIYSELDGFANSRKTLTVIEAIEYVENREFSKAIQNMLKANVPVKITYLTDGGDFSGNSPVKSDGISYMLPISSEQGEIYIYNKSSDFDEIKTPSRSGFRFVKWELVAYSYDVADENAIFELQLKAIWSNKEYTISYDLDGGNVYGNPVEYGVKDDEIILLNPTKYGYDFIGWTGTDLDVPTMTVTIPSGSYGNRSYKANFAPSEYTVTFNANGGTVSKTSMNIRYNNYETLPVPQKTGCKFEGWYYNSVEYTDGIWKVTQNITLTAKWSELPYTVTYNLNGGQNNSNNKTSYTVSTASFTLLAPTRAGYTFTGWTYAGQTSPIKNVTVTKGSTGNKTYTANWQANTNTIVFNANGGSGTMANQGMKTDSTGNLNKCLFTRENFTFVGWATTPTGAKVYNDQQSYQMGTSSTVTLYAVWKAKVTEGLVFTEVDDGYSVTGYTGTDTDVVIPQTYNGKAVTSIGDYAFRGKNNITSVEIPNSVTSIGLGAFSNCTGLTSVTFPDSVKRIESAAFCYCSNISTITFGSGIEYIGDAAFVSSALDRVNVTNLTKWCSINKGFELNDSGISDIYVNGKLLTELVIPEGVTTIGYGAFAYSSITSVVIPNSVTTIESGAFWSCWELEEDIIIPSSVTKIESGAFGNIYAGNSNYNEITIYCEAASKPEGWDEYWKDNNITVVWGTTLPTTEGLQYTLLDSDTYSITGYTGTDSDVVIPNTYNGKAVTKIGYKAFNNNSVIKSVLIPQGVTDIDCQAFYQCSQLEKINIPSTVSYISFYAFGEMAEDAIIFCENESNGGSWNSSWSDGSVNVVRSAIIDYESGLTFKKNSDNELILAGYIGAASFVVIPETYNGYKVVDIGYPSALDSTPKPFKNCTNLEKIILPNTIEFIGYYAFSGCTHLKELVLPDSLKEIYVNAFTNCTSLEYLIIPDSVTSIASYAFAGSNLMLYLETKSTSTSLFLAANWNAGVKECIWDASSDGLQYTLQYDHYIVTGYTGNSTCVIIPDTYNGKPVVSVNTFLGYSVSTVRLGKNIRSLSCIVTAARSPTIYYSGTTEEWYNLVGYDNNSWYDYGDRTFGYWTWVICSNDTIVFENQI